MEPSAETAKKVSQYKRYAQGFEIGGVIILTSLLGLFWLQPVIVSRWIAAAEIIILGLVFLSVAIYCAYRADALDESGKKDAQIEADSKTYVISKTRIEVLKEKGVPDSVRSFLTSLISSKTQGGNLELDVLGEEALIIKGADLATALRNGLGSQIVRQFKETVFEYTLKDNTPPTQDAKDQTEDASTPNGLSTNSQVSQLKPDPVTT